MFSVFSVKTFVSGEHVQMRREMLMYRYDIKVVKKCLPIINAHAIYLHTLIYFGV